MLLLYLVENPACDARRYVFAMQVVVVAAICEFLGAMLLGSAVTSTIKCAPCFTVA